MGTIFDGVLKINVMLLKGKKKKDFLTVRFIELVVLILLLKGFQTTGLS